MGKSLGKIAEQLKESDKKVQLIYAFNGTGKTRLSWEFKKLLIPHNNIEEDVDASEDGHCYKILYYNSHTEDLFYWKKNSEPDTEPTLLIQPNSFTTWILKEQGQDQNIVTNFQHYTNSKIMPYFNPEFSEVTFSIEDDDEDEFPLSFPIEFGSKVIKISKGEESNFIWSIFYTLFEQIIAVLNTVEPDERETDQFNQLEYIFIDDPVSSLDENHLIELAVNLAQLIKSSQSELKFIITTHNPLFYNVLHNEFKKNKFDKYILKKEEDGTHELIRQNSDSPFAYHLYIKNELKKAIENDSLSKYHFNLVRNILEKTATFLGHEYWSDILPSSNDGRQNPYEKRLIDISSHSKFAGDEVAELTENDKRVLKFLVRGVDKIYQTRMSSE